LKNPSLRISAEVAHALELGTPVVALESTVITHGLPRPKNLELARNMEKEVRACDAVPATIALLDDDVAAREQAVLPATLDAHAEALLLLRDGERPGEQFALRLWPAPASLDDGTPLWLGTAQTLHLPNDFLNEIVLPTDRLPPHDEYERRLHVNPQSRASLRKVLRRHGFRVRTVDYWEPPPPSFLAFHIKRLSVQFRLLDAVRFLRPLSRFPPLNRLFSNHIWIVAERR